MKFIILALCVLLVSGCANRAILTDYDPNIDFSGITRITVAGQSHENEPAQSQVIELVRSRIQNENLLATEKVETLLSVRAYIEQRANDQTLTIGVGAGNVNRHSSISVGTSVNVPIGDDLVDWQVIQFDLIKDNQVIWTAMDSAKLKIKDGKGRLALQQKMLERLFSEFPLIASASPHE